MRRNDEDLSHPRARRIARSGPEGWTAYAPLEAGCPAVTEVQESLRERLADERLEHGHEPWLSHERFLERRESLKKDFAGLFEAKAKEVVGGRAITIETTFGAVRAKLVKFRNGAVFETERVSLRSRGHGMTRVERHRLIDPVPLIGDYLVQAVV